LGDSFGLSEGPSHHGEDVEHTVNSAICKTGRLESDIGIVGCDLEWALRRVYVKNQVSLRCGVLGVCRSFTATLSSALLRADGKDRSFEIALVVREVNTGILDSTHGVENLVLQ
jgi:hypothetical protein